MCMNNSIWCVPLHVQCSKTNKGLTNIWHCWKDQTLGFPSKFAVWSSCCLYRWLKETHSMPPPVVMRNANNSTAGRQIVGGRLWRTGCSVTKTLLALKPPAGVISHLANWKLRADECIAWWCCTRLPLQLCQHSGRRAQIMQHIIHKTSRTSCCWMCQSRFEDKEERFRNCEAASQARVCAA